LEGLELQAFWTDAQPDYSILHSTDSTLFLTNCRVVVRPSGRCVFVQDGTRVTLRNCEFLSPEPSYVVLADQRKRWCQFLMENSISTGGVIFTSPGGLAAHEYSIRLSHNTFVTTWSALMFLAEQCPRRSEQMQERPSPPVRVHLDWNIVDAGLAEAVHFGFDQPTSLNDRDFEEALSTLYTWTEKKNLYAVRRFGTRRAFVSDNPKTVPLEKLETFRDWEHFWKVTDTSSAEGRPLFQCRASLRDSTPSKLVPGHFRLRADSPGHKGGPHGTDLGADTDLVGPGPAYERWKKTVAYQQWLTETGQKR
jgi:hypothetical protein